MAASADGGALQLILVPSSARPCSINGTAGRNSSWRRGAHLLQPPPLLLLRRRLGCQGGGREIWQAVRTW